MVIGGFMVAMAYLPLYTFEKLVIPQLVQLQGTYRSAEKLADAVSQD